MEFQSSTKFVLRNIGEIEMARSLTQKEIDTYQTFCREHNIVADESEVGLQNGETIGTYVAITWGVDFTPATLAVALDKLRGKIVFYTPAQAEYKKVADENPAAANQLNAWFENQNILVKEGDFGLQNQTTLLTELRGREITKDTIAVAIERVKAPVSKFHAARRPLHEMQAPRRTEPISPAAKDDDGVPFLGRNMNEPEWVRRSRERSEREAREAANQPSSTSVRSRAAAEAREKAESLQSSTHAETDQLRRIFVTSGTEIDWQATLASRLQMQKQFDKAREVRRFVR
jgi:hypothetical protein